MPAVAIITGGGRGIGAATAVGAADRGYDVCVVYRERGREAADVVARCEATGRRAIAAQADVSLESDVERVFSTVDEELGIVTALVNNAGIVAPLSRVDEMDGARIETMMRVNVVGPFL